VWQGDKCKPVMRNTMSSGMLPAQQHNNIGRRTATVHASLRATKKKEKKEKKNENHTMKYFK